MVMMTCGENEENAENKCDDYHGDELGLEYEVDAEVEFAEIQLDIRGHVQMTSVLRGGGGVSQFMTIEGGGCVISILEILTGGGGVKNPEN